MALARYSDSFWFPNGILAQNVPATVFPQNNSALATLWADAAGTVPLPNPLNTNALGVLTFYATVGTYWVHIDTETFLVDVGMSQEQADLTTGVSSGGDMEINAGNPQAINIAPLIGYVVDNTDTSPALPSIIRVDFPAQTVALDAAALLRPITWWLVDSTGTVIQQAARPDGSQRRTHILLGATVFESGSNQIIEVQTLPVILPQQGNQLVDLMDGLGPFSVSGNRVTAAGVNLSFDKSSGILFARAFNHFVGPVLSNNPHFSASPAQAPAQFRRVTQNITSFPAGGIVTTVDPANYDVGGVVTPVGGGVNTSTIQRVYLFATNLPQNQMLVQYGQQTYSSLANAVAAIGAGTFVPAPVNTDGTLIGYIAMIRSATDLSSPTQAVFVNAGKFATP